MHRHDSTWPGEELEGPVELPGLVNLQTTEEEKPTKSCRKDNEGIALKPKEEDTDTTRPMRSTKRLFAIKAEPWQRTKLILIPMTMKIAVKTEEGNTGHETR